jgi:hypothetical protein
MSQQPTSAPRRRHLLDPNAPRKTPDPEALERLARVQRRVVSALILTTIFHLTLGFIIAAKTEIAGDRVDAQVVLIVVGSLFWVSGVAAVRALNSKPLVTAWMLTGLVLLVAGTWWCVFA